MWNLRREKKAELVETVDWWLPGSGVGRNGETLVRVPTFSDKRNVIKF